MKKLLLILISIFVQLPVLPAQIIAGETPENGFLLPLNIELNSEYFWEIDSCLIDLNCDNIFDIKFLLEKEDLFIDGSNSFGIELINPDLEVCAYLFDFLGIGLPVVRLFNENEAITCTDEFDWNQPYPFNDPYPQYTIGVQGFWISVMPFTGEDIYFAYSLGNLQENIGWIKISFNVDASVSENLYAMIKEAIVFCETPTGLNIATLNVNDPLVKIFPNPTAGSFIRAEFSALVQYVEILNVHGQVLKKIPGNEDRIELPDKEGLYYIKGIGEEGKTWIGKVIRLGEN